MSERERGGGGVLKSKQKGAKMKQGFEETKVGEEKCVR